MLANRMLAAAAGVIAPTRTFLQATQSATDASSYTFSSQNIGTADATRRILVRISARSSDGGARTISSVTVGGISATAVTGATANNSGNTAAIYIVAVPTGTTADVVVTWSSGMSRCGIALDHVINLSSDTRTDAGTSTADPGTASLNISAGGFAIAVARSDTNGTDTINWTNLTADFIANQEGNRMAGAGAAFAGAQSSLALTGDFSSAATRPVFAAASFR